MQKKAGESTETACPQASGLEEPREATTPCGHVLDSLDLDVREWDYPGCGMHHDRDLNAAKSVLAKGLRRSTEEYAVSAWGSESSNKPAWQPGKPRARETGIRIGDHLGKSPGLI